MVKRILQVVFALAIFWVFWQGIDWVSQAVWGISGFLDVLVSLLLIFVAALVAWNLGDFLAGKSIEFYQRRRNI